MAGLAGITEVGVPHGLRAGADGHAGCFCGISGPTEGFGAQEAPSWLPEGPSFDGRAAEAMWLAVRIGTGGVRAGELGLLRLPELAKLAQRSAMGDPA